MEYIIAMKMYELDPKRINIDKCKKCIIKWKSKIYLKI